MAQAFKRLGLRAGHRVEGLDHGCSAAKSRSPARRCGRRSRQRRSPCITGARLASAVRKGTDGPVVATARRRPDGRRRRDPRGRGPPAVTPMGSASRPSGLEPGRIHRRRRPAPGRRRSEATGSTRWVIATAGRCSPTWASTRAGWPPTSSSARTSPTSPTTAWCPGSPSPIPRSAPSVSPRPRPASSSLDVRAVTCGSTSARAGRVHLGNGIKGTSQLVVDEARRVVVGATFTGPAVQELLHSATSRHRRRGADARGCGTPSRRSPRSARSGCGCSRVRPLVSSSLQISVTRSPMRSSGSRV